MTWTQHGLVTEPVLTEFNKYSFTGGPGFRAGCQDFARYSLRKEYPRRYWARYQVYVIILSWEESSPEGSSPAPHMEWFRKGLFLSWPCWNQGAPGLFFFLHPPLLAPGLYLWPFEGPCPVSCLGAYSWWDAHARFGLSRRETGWQRAASHPLLQETTHPIAKWRPWFSGTIRFCSIVKKYKLVNGLYSPDIWL